MKRSRESGRVGVDESSTPSVEAGAEITPGTHGVRDRGTAGMIVTKNGKNYVMTAAHVLLTPGTDPDLDLVYQPHYSDCAGIACNKPFGTVDGVPEKSHADNGPQKFAVDAALIELASEAEWSNQIKEIGMIAGTRDIIAELGSTSYEGDLSFKTGENAPLSIPVEKYGATTFHTYGVARRLVQADWNGWLCVIDAVVPPNGTPPSRTYALDMASTTANYPKLTTPQEVADGINVSTAVKAVLGGTATAPTITITGPQFSNGGDSGAPIVDASRNVIGLVQGGPRQLFMEVDNPKPVEVNLGVSYAVFIQAALGGLQVAFAPGQSSAGAPVVVPGMALQREHRPFDAAAVARLQHVLASSNAGGRLQTLVRGHLAEIRRLVHHRRRVTVTWHRQRGPAFIAAVLRASHEPMWPIPHEIDGVRLVDMLVSMRGVLGLEGSEALRVALDANAAEVLELVRDLSSIDEFSRRLAS